MAVKVYYAPYIFLNKDADNKVTLFVGIPLAARTDIKEKPSIILAGNVKFFEFKVCSDPDKEKDWFYFKKFSDPFDDSKDSNDPDQSLVVQVLGPPNSGTLLQSTRFFSDVEDSQTPLKVTDNIAINSPYIYHYKAETQVNGATFKGYYLVHLKDFSFHEESLPTPNQESQQAIVSLVNENGGRGNFTSNRQGPVSYLDLFPIDGFFEVITDVGGVRRKGKARNKPADTKPLIFMREDIYEEKSN